MWTVKNFKSVSAKKAFIERNKHRYQIVELFVANGYAVEYKPLRGSL